MGLARRHLQSVPTTGPADADALLARTARGDADAFAALYDLISPTVVGIARRVVRDPHQADEVAQEVLLEVWRLAPTYDRAKGSCKTWIATIAHRRAVDRVRSEQAERSQLRVKRVWVVCLRSACRLIMTLRERCSFLADNWLF